MSRLDIHKPSLYEIRFSTMVKPAGEVAGLTNLESHTTRARMLMLWRIAEGYLSWGPREAEILYQSTLDSISEVFDIFHHPVSQIMLDARADVWERGLAPAQIKQIIEQDRSARSDPPAAAGDQALLLAGELAQITRPEYLRSLETIQKIGAPRMRIWETRCGALPFALGAREIARQQALQTAAGIVQSQADTIIYDGPETGWALLKIFPQLEVELPAGIRVMSLDQFLASSAIPVPKKTDCVMIHDSRPACLLADSLPSHLSILPQAVSDEAVFGSGQVFELPRQLVRQTGAQTVFGVWTRGLAKSCGADDGLWLTHPDLAQGLARQRLHYARQLGARVIVTSSPLCAAWLNASRVPGDPAVGWLPEYLYESESK